MSTYLRPTKLDEALAALATNRLAVLAGGTDYYPARVGKPINDDILDISGIAGLRGIRDEGDHWRIGATTAWSDLAEANLPPMFAGLKAAARQVGGVQIQNAGTLAGNLCNASPAADGVPPLLALDASVEIADSKGSSSLALADFILGNRKTALQPGQLLTAILVPKARRETRSHFLKLGAREYLVVSIAMVAATLEIEAGCVRAARIAVGSCSPVAQRLPLAEAALAGKPCNAALGELLGAEHLAELAPIDDVRASGEYRLEAALTLAKRAVNFLGAQA